MEHPTGITRRGLMGAMGGALAGGLTASDIVAAGPAVGQDGTPLSPDGDGVVHPSTIPDPTSATSYMNLGLWSFRSNDPAVAGVLGYGWISAPGQYLEAELRLPVGTQITEVTVWANNTSGSSVPVECWAWSLDGSSALLFQMTVPNGTTMSTPISYTSGSVTMQPGYFYTLSMYTATSSVGIRGARLGYSNTGAYTPVSPYRCYDSRFTLAGRINTNTSRTLDVNRSINVTNGTETATGLIPANARAVTFNLQAVGATGANNFAITNGDALVAAASHIVFNSSTPTVANAGTVDVADGYVKIFGGSGPGAAHCILDITGYYV